MIIDLADTNITLDIIENNVTVENVNPETNLTLDLNSFYVSSGSQAYVHNQTQASNQWIINHNFGYMPITQVFNSGSQEIFGNIINTSVNQCVVQFNMPITGFARLI